MSIRTSIHHTYDSVRDRFDLNRNESIQVTKQKNPQTTSTMVLIVDLGSTIGRTLNAYGCPLLVAYGSAFES